MVFAIGLSCGRAVFVRGLCLCVKENLKKRKREREGGLGELVAGTIKTSQLLGLWLITASVDIY